ncbi:molecular chaperone GrpE [Marchantia polymorpha subsp. ruderalis]|uniref:GrpE protein homolog n=2 Tax=Marchantia polymorpha TaxID=3197 RepID=A0A176WGI7_MARPO|nr:hypothetical protein AXG93_2772s1130 [Marchantia polymorpha subsp. ruderalis]PTQ28417.1 hypothetical protein MARPO_0164s0013 [Marchantia polymorpha]BBN09338.1 hypothetical protein Mp_4g18970 [Marchantia polymorpha subsp. ruderalis]|eukprot:PTQ28417.1 hypothetical protein MARPO_0164s0013 [Marchantia polymorpha]
MAVATMPGALACSSFTALSASRGVCSPARTSLALSGSRPITSLAAQSFRGVTFNRSSRLWRPVMVAQKASQTETEEDEEEKEVVEEEPEETNGVAYPTLLQELRDALAANDEASIASLEEQLKAIGEERDSLGKLVNTLTEEIQTGKERFLRLNADFDNFRKRADAEKSQISNNVRGDVIESLLPMVDNFERAKASIKTETEGEQKIDRSYQSIYKQFVEIMKSLGVVAVETTGKAFDPNLHEAIMREESTEFEEGIVLQEFRRGFVIGSKLLRPAMVKVSAGPGPEKEAAEAVVEEPSEEVIDVEAE